MGLAEFFGFASVPSDTNEELPALFGLGMDEKDFVRVDMLTIYRKILVDTFERSHGLSDELAEKLWDNCLASEGSQGLITLLATAIVDKSELYLVYDKATKVLRKADAKEQQQIKDDYETGAASKAGIYVSFKKYDVIDMIKIYSTLEFNTVASFNKSVNISRTIQFKISELRKSVSLVDAAAAREQVKSMANAMKKGRELYSDAADIIELAKPDLTAAKSSMELFDNKRGHYLGMPSSYVTSILNSGLGDSGKADSKGVERGLRAYFYSMVKPVVFALWGVTLTFKSDDFDMLDTALMALKAFEATSEEFLSAENKLTTINKLFGLPAGTKGGPKPAPPTTTPPALPGGQSNQADQKPAGQSE